jgi:DNA ligase (NAD+)
MLSLGFNLEKTPLKSESSDLDTLVAGKGIVFTGKMLQGSREDMQALARKLGAKVQIAVSSRTDYLVCGEKVGEKKIQKAKGLNVQIISETQYIEMING